MEADSIDDVRGTSDLTMDRATARVAWSMQARWRRWSIIADILHPDHFSPPAGRTSRSVWLGAGSVVRAAERGVSRLLSTEGHGVVDFRTGGCLMTGRKLGFAVDTYFCPGCTPLRRHRDGTWRETGEQSAHGSGEYSPIWLVELPRGVTQATASGQETVDGAPCRRLHARCDPSLAAQRSRHGMRLPDFGSPEPNMPDLLVDQRSVPTDLWIDSSGCVRRIRTTFQIGEPDEVVKETMGLIVELSLRDLGAAPAPVPLPGAAGVEGRVAPSPDRGPDPPHARA